VARSTVADFMRFGSETDEARRQSVRSFKLRIDFDHDQSRLIEQLYELDKFVAGFPRRGALSKARSEHNVIILINRNKFGAPIRQRRPPNLQREGVASPASPEGEKSERHQKLTLCRIGFGTKAIVGNHLRTNLDRSSACGSPRSLAAASSCNYIAQKPYGNSENNRSRRNFRGHILHYAGI
jgi:hypothetical protein